MAAATTQTASSSPILDPSPNPAPSAADYLPGTEKTGQNAPSVSIKGGHWKGMGKIATRKKEQPPQPRGLLSASVTYDWRCQLFSNIII